MKCLILAERNRKELLRDPVSWIFAVALPLVILTVMQIILNSLGEETVQFVPMFAIERFTGGTLIFAFAFLTMLCSMILSKDRSSAFLSRLFASPLRAHDYIIGYTLPAGSIALLQTVCTFLLAVCFGLTVSFRLLILIPILIPTVLLFIGIGLIFGSVLSEKAAPGIASAVVQVAALFSGMWFDLDMVGGGFSTFCHVLPFANAYDLIRYTISGEYTKLPVPLLVVLLYAVVLFLISIFLFAKTKKAK